MKILSVLVFVGFYSFANFSAARADTAYPGFGRDAQHTALSTVAAQPLQRIVWQTPVDLQPQFSGNDLLIHYGSPIVTPANTVIVPVKTGATDGFEVQGRSGSDGTLLWTQTTDYTLPAHNWTPSYSPTLTPQGRLYFAGAGGTLYYRDNLNTPGSVIANQVAFVGLGKYQNAKSKYDAAVRINTPLTSDSNGNIYFGFLVSGKAPNKLKSGLARIDASGNGRYVSMGSATGRRATSVVMNCAPALSNDGATVYFLANGGTSPCLVALNSTTLSTTATVVLRDPRSGNPSSLPDDGTASPTVGPDGRVYVGVLESPRSTYKGWLLQFNADLSRTGSLVPGAFGWDYTASIVPAPNVPTYTGSSSYLLMAKYNNYIVGGGDGRNEIAILDPNNSQVDSRTGVTVMKEVLTIAGPTPDAEHPEQSGAVREWCINTAAVDPFTHAVLANSEDGRLYRWDITTNMFTESITLTAGVGEAYTPTVVGADGKVYAINNATLFAVGANP